MWPDMEAVMTKEPVPRSLKWAPTALAQWKVLSYVLIIGSILMHTRQSPVQISLDDLVPSLDGTVEDTTVSGTTSVGDKSVDLAKVLDDGVNERLDALPVANV